MPPFFIDSKPSILLTFKKEYIYPPLSKNYSKPCKILIPQPKTFKISQILRNCQKYHAPYLADNHKFIKFIKINGQKTENIWYNYLKEGSIFRRSHNINPSIVIRKTILILSWIGLSYS